MFKSSNGHLLQPTVSSTTMGHCMVESSSEAPSQQLWQDSVMMRLTTSTRNMSLSHCGTTPWKGPLQQTHPFGCPFHTQIERLDKVESILVERIGRPTIPRLRSGPSIGEYLIQMAEITLQTPLTCCSVVGYQPMVLAATLDTVLATVVSIRTSKPDMVCLSAGSTSSTQIIVQYTGRQWLGVRWLRAMNWPWKPFVV